MLSTIFISPIPHHSVPLDKLQMTRSNTKNTGIQGVFDAEGLSSEIWQKDTRQWYSFVMFYMSCNYWDCQIM